MTGPAAAGDVLDTDRAGGLVVRGGLIRVVGFGAGTLLSLLGVVLLTRHLGVGDFGRYQTVISLVTVVATITDAGMASLAVREFTQRRGEDRADYMEALLGLRLALTALGVAIAAAIAIAIGLGSELVLGTLLMGLGLVLTVVQSTLGVPLQADLRLGWVTAIDVARNGLLTLLIVVLVLAGADVLPFLGVTIPTFAVLIVWTAVLVRGQVPLRPVASRARWIALLKPALAFSVATAVGTLYVFTAQLLTAAVTGPEQTGLFSAAFRVFIVAGAIPGVLVAGAFPLLSRAARDDRARLAYALGGTYAGMAVLGGAAALVCALGAPPIIEVVAGPDYEGAVPVLRIQGIALLLSFLAAPAGFALLALHEHRALLLANLVALVVTAAAVPLLADAHGARGAAYGTLLGELLMTAGYVVGLLRADRALVPRPRMLGKVLLAGAVALLVLATGLPAVPLAAAGVAVYGVALVLLRAIPDEIIDLLPERLRPLLGRRRT